LDNVEVIKKLLKETEDIFNSFRSPLFGNYDSFKKEIFRALVKLTAERGVER